MLGLQGLTARRIVEKIRDKEITAEEYVSWIFERIQEVESRVHAFVTLIEDEALQRAREIDEKALKGKTLGRLAGVAMAVKDNICTKGIRTTCSSRMLENFVPPYDATVIERIQMEDAIIIGKTNMDSYAMGSTTETSDFGPTYNPWNINYVPGGSSGGSVAAIMAGEATLALGSDTGGSVRCPASFCSAVGLKPTFGLVSRYGLIAYANSLEQIGPITRDVYDCALLLSIIAGHDPRDSTSINAPKKDYTRLLVNDVTDIKIGVPKEFFGEGVNKVVSKTVWDGVDKLAELGAFHEETSLPSLEYALPAYYLIAISEASSNLARYDGIRYGYRIDEEGLNWNETFSKSRRIGLGSEVKRRIILGTFALSAGYYNRYYLKALKVKTIIKREFEEAFKKYDVLIGPTMPTPPFKIREKIEDPLSLYLCDILTVPINLAGLPAISIPCGFTDNLPIGVQIIGKHLLEGTILRVAYTFERNTDFHKQKPNL
ncbi:MAG: Amidase [Candidatus Bathyarchaeota archaeon BA1]|nr:MAG: Amidase [Candidatus Bathyarchaeota archaeon BA1]